MNSEREWEKLYLNRLCEKVKRGGRVKRRKRKEENRSRWTWWMGVNEVRRVMVVTGLGDESQSGPSKRGFAHCAHHWRCSGVYSWSLHTFLSVLSCICVTDRLFQIETIFFYFQVFAPLNLHGSRTTKSHNSLSLLRSHFPFFLQFNPKIYTKRGKKNIFIH